MYDYIALRLDASPCNEDITDLLAAFLADIGFDTFEPDDKGLTAYIRKDLYNSDNVREIVENFPIPTSLTISEKVIEGEDWNSEWEKKYFKPIVIGERLLIRSSFHKVPVEMKPEIEILIDPKMAFGTGHHATTAGMSKMLLDTDVKGKTVIDMGTGTGILAILAKKLGAGKTVGIDIDEYALENAVENGALNEVGIDWIVGDDKAIANIEPADIFLANINLNVILSCLTSYISKLKKGGLIFLSGFLTTDRDNILREAENNGLLPVKESKDNNWMVMVFEKQA